jgi:hypothetical protein
LFYFICNCVDYDGLKDGSEERRKNILSSILISNVTVLFFHHILSESFLYFLGTVSFINGSENFHIHIRWYTTGPTENKKRKLRGHLAAQFKLDRYCVLHFNFEALSLPKGKSTLRRAHHHYLLYKHTGTAMASFWNQNPSSENSYIRRLNNFHPWGLLPEETKFEMELLGPTSHWRTSLASTWLSSLTTSLNSFFFCNFTRCFTRDNEHSFVAICIVIYLQTLFWC